MRVENKHAADIKRILQASAKQIEADILKLESKGGNKLSMMQLKAQQASVRAYLDQNFKDIESVIAKGKVAAATASSKVVSMYENDLLKMVMTPQMMKQLATSEAKRAAEGLEAALRRMEGSSYKPLSGRVYDTKKLATGWVDDKINQALVSGWDAKRLAKEISGSIRPDTPGGVSYAANRLARTEINNAFHASAAKRYQDSGIVDGVDWNLSSSHPEGDVCDSLAGDSPYDVEEIPAKPHPNCYCYITPHLPEPDEFIDNLLAGKYGDEPWFDDAAGGITMSAEDMVAGMKTAEAARVSMERIVYDRKGNLNKSRGWTADTYKARTSYTEMGHEDMNMLLRDPEGMAAMFADDPFWIEQAAKNNELMVELLSKNPTTSDMVVARGVLVTDKFNPGTLKVGESFADPAFLSTTTNLDEALNFAAGRGRVADADGWTFVTKVPKGTNAVPGADYQNEIVFGPGQMQRVTGIDEEKRIIYTEMTS